MSEQMFDDGAPRLRQLPDGRWAEIRPERCPACGLDWPRGVAGRVLVGTHTCRCPRHMHRTYQCEGCRIWVFAPPLAEGCTEDGPPIMSPSGRMTRRLSSQ